LAVLPHGTRTSLFRQLFDLRKIAVAAQVSSHLFAQLKPPVNHPSDLHPAFCPPRPHSRHHRGRPSPARHNPIPRSPGQTLPPRFHLAKNTQIQRVDSRSRRLFRPAPILANWLTLQANQLILRDSLSVPRWDKLLAPTTDPLAKPAIMGHPRPSHSEGKPCATAGKFWSII